MSNKKNPARSSFDPPNDSVNKSYQHIYCRGAITLIPTKLGLFVKKNENRMQSFTNKLFTDSSWTKCS